MVHNFKGLKKLENCLVSLNKTGYPNMKIIVVDALTDGIEGWMQSRFEDVDLLHFDKDYGIPYRRNCGLEKVGENSKYIVFMDEEIHRLRTEEIVRKGIVYVPEEKMLFRPLPVEENLLLGSYVLHDKGKILENLEFIYKLFPVLKERREQAASTLSGGEQQMLAIGRGLMSNPKMLMLDEPSLGLAPILVDEVLDTVRRLKEEGMTILLVEQNVRESLDLADRGYVLQTGQIITEGTGKELLESDVIRSAFLGI